jgi:hypothetical protein
MLSRAWRKHVRILAGKKPKPSTLMVFHWTMKEYFAKLLSDVKDYWFDMFATTKGRTQRSLYLSTN